MPDWLLALFAQVFVAGAIYGAMKADLKALHEKVASAQATAVRANDRVDNLILNGGNHGKA